MAGEANLDVKDNTVEGQTTEPESSTAETNNGGVFAIEDLEDSNSAAESSTNADGDAKDKTEGQTDDGEPQANAGDNTQRKNAEMRKQQLNNEIRDKVAERNALKREIAELNRQKYQLKTPDDIPTVDALMEQINPDTNDYFTRNEAEIARMKAERELERAERQMDEYTDNIVENRLRLRDEADRALKEFPMFDEESPEYNKELSEQADQIVDGLIIKDNATGEIIGSRGSIYNIYATIAKAAKFAETKGKVAGRQAAVNMMNSADVMGSGSTSTTPSDDNDPILAGFEKARSRNR